MKTLFKKALIGMILTGLVMPAQLTYAEDTDIYAADTGAATNPNILIVLDNSANWARNDQSWPVGKQGEAELAALRAVLGEVGDNINLGLMMFTAGSGSTLNGGYIRYHIRQMTNTNKAAFQELIGTSTCTAGNNSLNGTPNCILNNFNGPAEKVGTSKVDYSAALFDVFKYFGGYTSPAHATDDTAGTPISHSQFGAYRYAGNPDTSCDASAYNNTVPAVPFYINPTTAASTNTPAYSTKINYNSPLSSSNSCAKNFVIFIGNGTPTQDSPASLLTGVGGNATQLSAPDLALTTTPTQTTLATNVSYASQAACETAAATLYANQGFDSFSCTVNNTSTTTATTALGTSSCGLYSSASACATAESASHPSYNGGVSCTVANASCGTTTTALGTSSCGLYASASACATTESAKPANSIYNGGVSCAVANASCSSSTTTALATSSCGLYASAGVCGTTESAKPANSIYNGGVSCAVANASCATPVVTNYGTSTCGQYASASACATAQTALHPEYNGGVSCSTVATSACSYNTTNSSNPIGTVSCATNGLSLNTSAGCTSYGNSNYSNYSGFTCTSTGTTGCSGGKINFSISATTKKNASNVYTFTGTNTPSSATFSLTGTKNVSGATYTLTGNTNPVATYTLTGTTTTTTNTYNIIGTTNLKAYTPVGTFNGTSSYNTDEWARFLNQTDVSSATGKQNISTYTIDVFNAKPDEEETKLLINMAKYGGGKYFAAKSQSAILDALRKIFTEIQSVNSVFASSSLPVSVNTQGTYLNQVFTGMFRPDGGAKPRWAGNLKQYKLKYFNGTLRLSDKNGDEAVNSAKGFITECANSFWSTDTGTYWNFSSSNALGTCTASEDASSYPVAGSSSAYSDAPDGNVVEKGGAAQRLRGVTLSGGVITTSTNYTGRNLKTCSGTSATSCTTLTDFKTSNAAITNAMLGVSTSTNRDNLINWVRGQDLDDENANTTLNEMRPSVHGGVIHSQPAVIDYGGSTGVISYYGDDEGVLHAIDGGQTDAEGTELWGFIAPETYGRLFRQRDNGATTALINFPGVSSSVSKASKDYFFDGSIGTYQNSSTVWIYPSMRRGGRGIYAFDVSTPSTPVLKWRKGCFTNSTSDDSSCSSGWSAIGQTWSKPQLTYLSGYVDSANNPKPVLVFGGGYDTCDDYDSQAPCAAATSRKGANVWFVDADTGNIITTYSTNYSVPGDVFLVKDTNGYLKYVYAADTGGYVYRINTGTYDGSTFSSWSSASQITIAYLSETNQSRKFLFGPDVVPYVGYNAIMIGSGDREHPLENNYACGSYSSTTGNFVTNQFYMIKDTLSNTPTVITASNLTDVTTNLTIGEAAIGSSGYRFNLLQCEQVVNKALTIGGIAFFGTNAPKQVAANSCTTNLGNARGYAIDFLTGNPVSVGSSRSVLYVGGGLPPSPVAGVVDIDGEKVPFIIGGSKPDDANPSPLQGSKVNINPVGPRKRVYWYIDTDTP